MSRDQIIMLQHAQTIDRIHILLRMSMVIRSKINTTTYQHPLSAQVTVVLNWYESSLVFIVFD